MCVLGKFLIKLLFLCIPRIAKKKIQAWKSGLLTKEINAYLKLRGKNSRL